MKKILLLAILLSGCSTVFYIDRPDDYCLEHNLQQQNSCASFDQLETRQCFNAIAKKCAEEAYEEWQRTKIDTKVNKAPH